MIEPVAFYFGQVAIHWYGIMVACGFIAATIHLYIAGKSKGGIFTNMPDAYLLWLMVGGIIGARATYVVANFSYFRHNFLEVFRLDHGGLVFYGGLIGAVIAGFVILKIRKDPLLETFDFFLTALPLGHAFGRIGCLLRGCCYGKQTECCFGIHLYNETIARHPTQLYEAIGNFFIYLILLSLFIRRKPAGVITASYLTLYGCLRFFNEFLRGDERLILFHLSIAQWMSVIMVASGLLLMLWLQKSRVIAKNQ